MSPQSKREVEVEALKIELKLLLNSIELGIIIVFFSEHLCFLKRELMEENKELKKSETSRGD